MIGCMFETRLALTAGSPGSGPVGISSFWIDSAFYLAEDPVLDGITFEGETIHLPDRPDGRGCPAGDPRQSAACDGRRCRRLIPISQVHDIKRSSP